MTKTATERKIVVLGDSGVGKTALIRRFMTGEFEEAYRPTAYAVPHRKVMECHGVEVTAIFWDVAGRMLNIHPAHISDAHGVVLVCDLSKQSTAAPMLRWHGIVREKVGDIPVLVAGNKSDLAAEDSCRALRDAGLKGYRTSAKTGENVDALFREIVGLTV
jgi:small GTP-binding protein